MSDPSEVPNDQPERLDLRSFDVTEDMREQLLRLCPEARTENGLIDFNQLVRALGEIVDPGRERTG
jgi:adenine-specific DNA-methyltransferase